MEVCIDIGNTDTKIGFRNHGVFAAILIINTAKVNLKSLADLFLPYIPDFTPETNVIIGSVVPKVTPVVKDYLKTLTTHIYVMYENIECDMELSPSITETVGADLIAGIYAAKHKYHGPVITIDLGTATKVCVCDKENSFKGCIIAPGLNISLNALYSSTSLLKENKIEQTDSLIACNTKDAISNGLLMGTYFMVMGLVNSIEKELGYEANKVFTGGCSSLIEKLLVKENYIYDKNLVLDGLHYILERKIANENQF